MSYSVLDEVYELRRYLSKPQRGRAPSNYRVNPPRVFKKLNAGPGAATATGRASVTVIRPCTPIPKQMQFKVLYVGTGEGGNRASPLKGTIGTVTALHSNGTVRVVFRVKRIVHTVTQYHNEPRYLPPPVLELAP